MCDPVTLAGVALSVAGGAGQAKTQQNYVAAQNQANRDAYALSSKARKDEQARQNEWTDQQTAMFNTTTDAMTKGEYDNTTAQGTSDFLTMLDKQPNAVQPTDLLQGQDKASTAVSENIARQTATAAADARDRVKALAKLTSYGTTNAGRGRTFADAADFTSTIGGLRRGSLAVANQEQNIAPAAVAPGSSTFADILSGVGGLITAAGPNLLSNFGVGAKTVPAVVKGSSALAPATSIIPRARPIY